MIEVGTIELVLMIVAFLVQFAGIVWGASTIKSTSKQNESALKRVMRQLTDLAERQRLFERETHARLSVVERVLHSPWVDDGPSEE